MAFKEATKSGGGDYPARWQKDTQNVIEGHVVDYKTNIMGKAGSDAITIENKDGKFTVWLDTMLKGFEELTVIGTKAKITFLGKEKSAKGPNSYNNYKVEIDPDEFKEF